MPWHSEELLRIAETDDLHISPLRDDGVSYGTPTWIWSVVVDGILYARAYNGTGSSWYQATIRQKAGRIQAGGMTRDVLFEPVAEEAHVNDRIDAAYRGKYAGSPYLSSMIGRRSRAATIAIMVAS